MNERKEKILDFDQIRAVEDYLVENHKNYPHLNYYAYLHKIFLDFLNEEGNEILNNFFKEDRWLRNASQVFVEMAFSSVIYQCYQRSGIFTLRKDIKAATTKITREQYYNDYEKNYHPKNIIINSRQPVLLEYLKNLFLESDVIKIGTFTDGEQLGDRAKRHEVVYDLSFIINYIGTFFFK